MEKFGIFELLDTLSALTADPAENGDRAPAEQGSPAAPPPAGAEAEKKSGERDALRGFLARHDEIARKADKN